jgi:hypothetical protein
VTLRLLAVLMVASVASPQGLYDKDLTPRQIRPRSFPGVGESPKGGRPGSISSLSPRTLRLDGLTNRGDDLAREGLNLAHMVLRWPVDKGVHPEL